MKVEDLYEHYELRNIRPEEGEEAAEIERICFPPNEACKRERILERVETALDLFLVAIEKSTGKMAGFLNGLATDINEFADDFFTDIEKHDEKGSNVMLLGLDVLPEHRNQGLGRELVAEYCRREKEKGRKRLVLTCHEEKVGMYRKFGFRDLGVSGSEWGGETWHEMDILL